jgi:hypothetical protein|tara:strand:+ start:350 stop:715 length:366 start_codon:yes stop_codon:yes gene_type:complete
MIIATTSTGAQNFKVIPRDYSLTSFTLKIRDDQTNTTVSYSITGASVSTNYVIFSNTFSPVLVSNHYYDFILVSAASLIVYKDRLFCTDQTINQANNNYYDLNEGVYTTYDGFNNEYIVTT